MRRRVLAFVGGIIFCFAGAGVTLAQDAQSSTSSDAQNADSAWAVIEYPEGKEFVVELRPTAMSPDAHGVARVMRSGNDTTINLEITGLAGETESYNLYAVDSLSGISLLGAVTVSEGTGTLSAKTPLNKFMLVLTPEDTLTTFDAGARVALRSTVPNGFVAVPRPSNEEAEREAVGVRLRDENASVEDPEYDAPMLGITSLRRGADTQMRISFSGELQGTRANVSIKARKKGGATQIKMRVFNMKEAPNGSRYVLWAVSPDNTYTRLGQAVKPGKRNEAKIEAETGLNDFGLFMTVENEDAPPSPTGALVAMVVR